MNSKTKFISDYVPSRQEMMDFIEGKLTPEDAEAMGVLAEKNPFIADAIEGLQMGIPEASFERIDNHVSKAVASDSGSSRGKLFTLTLVLGMAAAIAWWSQKNQNSIPEFAAEAEQPLQEDNDREMEMITEATQIEEVATPKEHHVVAHRTTDSSISVTISHAEGASDLKTDHYVHIGLLPDVDPAPLNGYTDDVVLPKRHSERIYHIEDYKVVDYRGKRSNDFKQWQIIPVGVPANMESANQDRVSQHPDMEIVAVPYVDYLEEAIVLFSTQKHKDCSKRLKKILEKYPDDINALFYLGLVQINLGKDKKAKGYFKTLKKQGSVTFDQEIDFYLAKTMLITDEKEEGKALLELISNSASFYAQQAQYLLADLN
ncbi:MAG: TolA-binding protein [Flavobacteriales bacterium]|jgi:TolA-binding protein